MTDFIIVGRGLAANVLMHRFHKNGISFKTIGNPSLSSSSRVAAGIWNPIVFKRMTKSWMADELIPNLLDFYGDCEKRLGLKLMHPRSIIKPFIEEQEKTLWLKKAGGELADYLDAEIQSSPSADLLHCPIPGEYGSVKQAGNIDMAAFLDGSSTFFKEHIFDETFDFAELKLDENKITYKQLTAGNIIFCEGFLVKNNPYFNWIPLNPAKGEVLEIKTEGLVLNHSIYNRNGFVLQMAPGTFKVGATYAWSDLEQNTTVAALNELKTKLNLLVNCPYQITGQQAGIRPASADRRPIIGRHPAFTNLFVFNGLGTKGVMLAPYFAENFVHCYLQKEELNSEVNVKRFYHLYENAQKK